MSLRNDFLEKGTNRYYLLYIFQMKAPMQLVIDRMFLRAFRFPPIDDISLSNSILSISPLPHLHRRAIGTAAVIAPLLPVLPILLEVLPSRCLVLARSFIVNRTRMGKGKRKR